MNENDKKGKDEIQEIIEVAIQAAYEAGIKGMEEKLKEAIKLGVAIGTKIGTEIGATKGAEIGAAAAVKAVEKERKNYKKQQYDWKYHNTKLLLRNYKRLNAYYENAIFDNEQAEENNKDFYSIMRNIGDTSDKIFVKSIQESYITTKIIMAHVNKMVECYKIMCKQSQRQDDKRHWRVLEKLYIADASMTAESIAKQEHIDKRTVYRDIDTCVSDLTALLFGVGGIEDNENN